MFFARSVVLGSETLKYECLGGEGVSLGGVVVRSLFCVLLLLRILDERLELYGASIHDSKADRVSTTHLVTETDFIPKVLRVIVIPGSCECVVGEPIVPARVLHSCRNLRGQFRKPSTLGQKICNLERDQGYRIILSVCLYVVIVV